MISVLRKIYYLLPRIKRRSALVLLALICLGTLLEILGIGLLLPVIALLMSDDLGSSYPELQPVLIHLGNPSHENQVMIVLAMLVMVYLAKNLYLAFFAWWQARFTVGLQIEFAQRLFTLYLRKPYFFHLQKNSAELVRNVTGEVGQFIGNALNPMLSLVAELLVLASIVILLLAVEPLGSIIVFVVLVSVAGIFYSATRNRITRWGEVRSFHDGRRMQHLQQGLGGVKDVKLLGREEDFLANFNEHNSQSGRMAQYMEIMQKMPRLWLEVLAVIGFAMLVTIMLQQGQEMSRIVPVMGLFAAAAFRLLPSVSRILISMQAMRYGVPAVNNLHGDLQLDVPETKAYTEKSARKAVFQNEICLSGISYDYPGTSTSALVDVSISIQRGESVGLIGPSGSGKSTLVDLILGLLTPKAGQVCVDEQDVQDNIRLWQDQIGYVPQAIYLTDDTLRRNIAFGLAEKQIDDSAVARAIHAAQLEDFITSLPNKLETMVGERGVRLSGGQRQRIGIARALYHDPGVLVLDEATSSLDTATESEVMKTVTELHGQKTVVIVAHRLSTVENCDRLYKLSHGMVVEEGTPAVMIPAAKKTLSH